MNAANWLATFRLSSLLRPIGYLAFFGLVAVTLLTSFALDSRTGVGVFMLCFAAIIAGDNRPLRADLPWATVQRALYRGMGVLALVAGVLTLAYGTDFSGKAVVQVAMLAVAIPSVALLLYDIATIGNRPSAGE